MEDNRPDKLTPAGAIILAVAIAVILVLANIAP